MKRPELTEFLDKVNQREYPEAHNRYVRALEEYCDWLELQQKFSDLEN